MVALALLTFGAVVAGVGFNLVGGTIILAGLVAFAHQERRR